MTVKLWALPPNAKTIAAINADGKLYVTQNFDNPTGPTWSTGLQLVNTSLVGPIDQFVVDSFSPGYLSNDPGGVINGWFTTAGKPRRPGPEAGGGLYRITDIFGATPNISLKFTFTLAAYSYSGLGAWGRNLKVSTAFEGWLAVLTHYQEDGTFLVYTLDGGTTWPGGENLINDKIEASENTYNHNPGFWLSSKTQGKAWLAAFQVGEPKEDALGGLYEVQMSASGISGTDTPITNPDLDLANGLGGEFHAPYYDNPQENILYYGKKVILPPWDQANYFYRSIGTAKQNISPIKSSEPHGRPMPNGGISTHITDQGRILLCGRSNGGEIYTVFVSSNGGASWQEAPFDPDDYTKDKYWRGQIASDGLALYLWGLSGTVGYSPDFANTAPLDRRGNLSTTARMIALISQTVIDATEPAHDGECCSSFHYAGNDCPGTPNPISLRKGEKRLEVTDLSLNTPAGPLTFTRKYRQSKQGDDDFHLLGLGWMHNHAVRLRINGNAAQVVLDNGSILQLYRVTTTQFKAHPGSNSEMNLANDEWTLTAPDESAYVFEDPGGETWRVKSRTWANGEAWTYNYDGIGKLTSVADDAYDLGGGVKRQLQFSYISNPGQYNDGKLWRVGDQTASGLSGSTPAGRYVEFAYAPEKSDGQTWQGAQALLVSARDVRGSTWTYDYYGQDTGESTTALLNFMIQRQSPAVDTQGDGQADGAITLESLSYLVTGGKVTGLTQQRGGGLLTTALAFDVPGPHGEQTTTEQIAGKTTRHYFERGVHAGVENALGNRASQSPNTQFRPTGQLDANGHATQLAWSGDGQQLQEVTDALGYRTAFGYNTNHTLASAVDAEGRTTEYAYGDASNPRLPTRIRVIDQDGQTMLRWQAFTYDSRGRTLTETVLDPADGVTVQQQVTHRYYTSGDGNGLLQSVTQVDPLDAAHNTTTTYTYDCAGRVIKTQKSSLLGGCQFTYTVYDAAGNVVATACGRENVTPPTSMAGAITLFNPRDPDRNRVTTYEYDALGRRVKTTTNAGAAFAQTTLTAYDALGRVIRTIANYVPSPSVSLPYTAPHPAFDHGADNDRNLVTDTAYNARGLVRQQVDALGHVTLLGYDDAGRLIKTVQNASQPGYNNNDVGISPDPALEHYLPGGAADQDIIATQTYDAVGNVVKTADLLGNVTLTGYDPLNRPVKVIRSASQPDYNFKADPMLTHYPPSADPDRDLIQTTEYDALGRVIRTRRLLDNRPVEQWETTLFGYDSLGRQVKAIRSASQPDYNLAADPSLNRYVAREDSDLDLVTLTVYDDAGRVMYTQDAGDVQTWSAYDGLGRPIQTIRNPLGTATDGGVKDPRSSSYNPVDNLPDRDVMTRTAYDPDGRVLWTQDTLGRRTWPVYDERGRVIRTIANATGTAVDFGPLDPRSPAYVRRSNTDQDIVTQTVYDAQGRVEKTIDPRGNQTLYRYDALGRRIQTIVNYVDGVYNASFPDEDRLETTVYDLAGRVVQTVDPAGIQTRHEYDALGRRVKTITNYVDGVYNANFPDEDLISTTVYNQAGQIIAATDARGTRTTFTYDRAGRRLTLTQAAGSSLTSCVYTCYDKAGRVRRTIQNWTNDPTQPSPDAQDIKGNWLFAPTDHGPNHDRDLVTEYVYDRAGRRTHVTDPAGHVTATTYLKDGQVQSVTDPQGAVTQFCYDGLRRRTRVVQGYEPNGENPSRWVWNNGWKRSNGTAIDHGTDNDQNIIVDTAYDRAGRRVSLRDPRGYLTTYRYDRLNRRTALTNPLGQTWETAYFTLDGGQTRTTLTYPGVTGAAHYSVQRDFDRLGRLLSLTYGDPSSTPDVKFAYDAAGNRSQMSEYGEAGFTNRLRETRYTYDDVHRLTAVGFDTDGDGDVDETVSYQYDAAGQRTRLTLPGDLAITYVYDARGRLVSLSDWDGHTSQFGYDGVGRPVATVRYNGLSSRYDYDLAGRLRQVRHHERNKLLARFLYDVDARGNRTQAIEQLAHAASVVSTIGINDAAVTYYRGTWSTSGSFKVTSDWWAGMKVTFTGNEAALTLGTGNDHGVFDIYVDGSLWESFDGYAAATGERVINLYLDRGGAHTLDLRNRREQHPASSGYVLRFKQMAVLNTDYASQTITYGYDRLARLLSADYTGVSPTRSYAYEYDLAGNRTKETVTVGGNATITERLYNPANQMINLPFTYDANGNLTADGVNTYTWDRANRLTSVGGMSYVYDGLGSRIQQTVSGLVIHYLLDYQPGLVQVLGETIETTTWHYVHGPQGLLARIFSNGLRNWTLPDGLGSVRSMLNDALGVEAMQSYTPVGEPLEPGPIGRPVDFYSSDLGMPFGFTGEMTDDDTLTALATNSLVYLRARYYRPALGIFPNLDPLEMGNRYQYVGANPTNWTDPSGYQRGNDAPKPIKMCRSLPQPLKGICLSEALEAGTGLFAGQVEDASNGPLGPLDPQDPLRRALEEEWVWSAHFMYLYLGFYIDARIGGIRFRSPDMGRSQYFNSCRLLEEIPELRQDLETNFINCVLNNDSSRCGASLPGIDLPGRRVNPQIGYVPYWAYYLPNLAQVTYDYENPYWRFRIAPNDAIYPDQYRALGTFSVGAHTPNIVGTYDSNTNTTTYQAYLEFWDNYDWINNDDPNAVGLHPFGMTSDDFRAVEELGLAKPYTVYSTIIYTLTIHTPAGNCGGPDCPIYRSSFSCINPPGEGLNYISTDLDSSWFRPFHTRENTDNVLYYPPN